MKVLLVALVLLLSLPAVVGQAAPAPQATIQVDARIQAVFPHDDKGNVVDVAAAKVVNVEVYLYQRGTRDPLPCGFDKAVTLHWSQNYVTRTRTEQVPARDVPGQSMQAIGKRVSRTVNGRTFDAWVFDDVPVQYGPSPEIRIFQGITFYFVTVEGANTRSNVWTHGADGRTGAFFSAGEGLSSTGPEPAAVETIIAGVWTHDRAGQQREVADADLANISVNVRDAGASQVPTLVRPDFAKPVRLLKAENDGYFSEVATSTKSTTSRFIIDGSRIVPSGPYWLFNDVEVSFARQPGNRLYFMADVPDLPTYPAIWAHAADARTIAPNRDIPNRDCR